LITDLSTPTLSVISKDENSLGMSSPVGVSLKKRGVKGEKGFKVLY
jgi:hypothetical protein